MKKAGIWLKNCLIRKGLLKNEEKKIKEKKLKKKGLIITMESEEKNKKIKFLN